MKAGQTKTKTMAKRPREEEIEDSASSSESSDSDSDSESYPDSDAEKGKRKLVAKEAQALKVVKPLPPGYTCNACAQDHAHRPDPSPETRAKVRPGDACTQVACLIFAQTWTSMPTVRARSSSNCSSESTLIVVMPMARAGLRLTPRSSRYTASVASILSLASAIR